MILPPRLIPDLDQVLTTAVTNVEEPLSPLSPRGMRNLTSPGPSPLALGRALAANTPHLVSGSPIGSSRSSANTFVTPPGAVVGSPDRASRFMLPLRWSAVP